MLKSKKVSTTSKSAETYFREAYNKTSLDKSDFDQCISRCRELIKKVTLTPTTSTIQNWEEYTRPSFARFTIQSESKPFYEASMAVAEFVTLLTLKSYTENPTKFTSGIGGQIQEPWEELSDKPKFQNVMCAAFGIAAGLDQFVDRFFTSETLTFLTKTVLLQSTLSQTQSYQLVLESFARIFVVKVLEDYRAKIQEFIQNENEAVQVGLFADQSRRPTTTEYSDFLKLVIVIARMYKRSDFQLVFFNLTTDLLSPENVNQDRFVAVYMDVMASLAVDKKMANAVYDSITKLVTYNLQHFLNAIDGYVSDFKQASATQSRLSELDSHTLEVKLDLIARLFKFNEETRKEINEQRSMTADLLPSDTLINNLISLIHSAIPATLKARCFDVLSSLVQDGPTFGVTWSCFESTEILTEDHIEKNSGGIISDIEEVEVPERGYPLLRSFIRFLSYLMARKDDHPSEECAQRVHTFLLENTLLQINNRMYSHFNEKWSILCELCQVWHNMFFQDSNIYNILLHTAFCDHRFVRINLSLINEEACPLETLL